MHGMGTTDTVGRQRDTQLEGQTDTQAEGQIDTQAEGQKDNRERLCSSCAELCC